jgi:membrane protein
MVRVFRENDLLTYASAISFQAFFAVIPLALLALGLLGSFGFASVWRTDVAPDVAAHVSRDAFKVIDETVTQVLAKKQLFWATIGALIAVWEVSGATRATMQVLNRIYGVQDSRPFRRRILISIWLAALVTLLLLVAGAVINVLPHVVNGGALLGIARWAVAVALLFLVVGIVVRVAPDTRRPVPWVTFGATLVIVGWIGGSLVYAWYVTSVADYGSLFGNLAAVMVTLGYIYVSSIVFLTGVQIDALIRAEVERSEAGSSPAPPRASSRREPAPV